MLRRPMKKALTIVIGFLHDFAAGCWGASVLAVYWVHRLESRQELGALFFGLKKQFFYLGLGCVAVVLVAGMGRTFTYVGDVYGKDAEQMRRKMLVVKHIFLLAVFGLGIWWQYTMVF